MSWARFDDHFDDDPDCDIVGPAAACLFICSITWSSRNETDGFIPYARAAKLMGCSPEAIDRLTQEAVRWWVEVPGGWQIRNYLKYNPSHAEQEALRAAKAEAGRKGGEKSGEVRRRNRPEAPAQPSLEAPALASATPLAKALPQALPQARTQAKTKPESRTPDSGSRTPDPESRFPKHTDPPTPQPIAEEPPEHAPPEECVCVLFKDLQFLEPEEEAAAIEKYGLQAVRWQAEAVRWRLAQGKGVENPASYLLDALEKAWPIPAPVRLIRDAEIKAEKDRQGRADDEAARRLAEDEKRRDSELDAAWERLPEEERARIERDAVRFASSQHAFRGVAAEINAGQRKMEQAPKGFQSVVKAFRRQAISQAGRPRPQGESP
jgi:hypothetical protein